MKHTHTHTHTHRGKRALVKKKKKKRKKKKTKREKKVSVKTALFHNLFSTQHNIHPTGLCPLQSSLALCELVPAASANSSNLSMFPFTHSDNGVLLVQQLSHFEVIVAKRAFHLDSSRLLHTDTKKQATRTSKPETNHLATSFSGWGETISQMSCFRAPLPLPSSPLPRTKEGIIWRLICAQVAAFGISALDVLRESLAVFSLGRRCNSRIGVSMPALRDQRLSSLLSTCSSALAPRRATLFGYTDVQRMTRSSAKAIAWNVSSTTFSRESQTSLEFISLEQRVKRCVTNGTRCVIKKKKKKQTSDVWRKKESWSSIVCKLGY